MWPESPKTWLEGSDCTREAIFCGYADFSHYVKPVFVSILHLRHHYASPRALIYSEKEFAENAFLSNSQPFPDPDSILPFNCWRCGHWYLPKKILMIFGTLLLSGPTRRLYRMISCMKTTSGPLRESVPKIIKIFFEQVPKPKPPTVKVPVHRFPSEWNFVRNFIILRIFGYL